jgi:uncharacterized coiled-coil protein SlyX
MENRVEELEMQNAFMQNQLDKMEENLTLLNKENHLIKAELKALRGIMTNLQDPDYIQEILHNGSNR